MVKYTSIMEYHFASHFKINRVYYILNDVLRIIIKIQIPSYDLNNEFTSYKNYLHYENEYYFRNYALLLLTFIVLTDDHV